MSEGSLELPAFAFVARCDDPISLLRRWGVLRELNSELQSHILPCCRYTKDATENGGVYGIRTREIPDRQSAGVDHWPNTPNGGSGATRTPNGLPRTCIRDRPTNQLSHASIRWRRDWESNPERIAPHGLASRSNTIIASLQDGQHFKEQCGSLHGMRRQNNLSGLASFAGPLFALMLHLDVCFTT